MSHGKPAEVVETFWVIRDHLGIQGLDIQGFIMSKLDPCVCCLAWVDRMPVVVFARVILGFGVSIFYLLFFPWRWFGINWQLEKDQITSFRLLEIDSGLSKGKLALLAKKYCSDGITELSVWTGADFDGFICTV